jgi:periplasmic copper chaperone A
MKTKRMMGLAGLCVGLWLGGCQSEEAPFQLSKAQITLPAVKGNPGAAYFTLSNNTDAAVTLTGVTVAGAERAEMHETTGGAMEPLASVAVPAKTQLTFAPGGRHAMVFGMPAQLAPGGKVSLTVQLADGSKVATDAEVLGPGMAGMSHDGATH